MRPHLILSFLSAFAFLVYGGPAPAQSWPQAIKDKAAQEAMPRASAASLQPVRVNWLGYFYGVKDFPIQYFPIDEEHPGIATDAYSLSKQVTEDIAAYYWRREGISSTCLRMPAVIDPTDERFRRMKEFFPRSLAMYNEWAAMPEDERSARLSQLLEKHSGWRAERWLEIPQEERQHLGLDFTNPDVRLVFSRANFWAMIDSRDAAQAFEKSLLAEFEGCHPLFVNDSHNSLGVETEELLRTFFPQVTARKRPLAGSEALVSIDRAREIIGFEPEHSFAASQDQNIAPA